MLKHDLVCYFKHSSSTTCICLFVHVALHRFCHRDFLGHIVIVPKHAPSQYYTDCKTLFPPKYHNQEAYGTVAERAQALQLQKTHANRKSTSKSRKRFHHFYSRWYKCSQHKQIKKHAANAHNITKYILFAAHFFFGCVVSICSVCVVKLTKVFS